VTRTFVIGDPQAPFAKVLEVLDRHGLLAGDRLADDVVLVSIGDHFDYDPHDPKAGDEGLRLLRWFASHDPAQVVILLGNHDAARVMELAALTDAGFAAARALAGDPVRYLAVYPALPPPGVLAKDYASFSEAQRALVIELLLAGRFRLAAVGELNDPAPRAGAGHRGPALLSHAGVTSRELAHLGLLGREDAAAIAAALDAFLAAAVARVRTDWERGVPAPLSLAPLHVTGGHGREGGGLLYHRPSNPETGSRFDPERPRRFDPRTLPSNVTQIVGHSGHAKCVQELGAWCTDAARARKHGGIRTLLVEGSRVTYDVGVGPDPLIALDNGVAELILVDGELRRVPAAEVALLPLGALR
jgi:hypothetical protein